MGHREQRPEIIALWLQDINVWIGFSPEPAKLLTKEQGLDSPERLRALTNNNVHDIYNVMRKLGDNTGQQLYVIA